MVGRSTVGWGGVQWDGGEEYSGMVGRSTVGWWEEYSGMVGRSTVGCCTPPYYVYSIPSHCTSPHHPIKLGGVHILCCIVNRLCVALCCNVLYCDRWVLKTSE